MKTIHFFDNFRNFEPLSWDFLIFRIIFFVIKTKGDSRTRIILKQFD
jgi:hypothetical protein